MKNKTIAIIAAVMLLIGGFYVVQAQEQPNEGAKSDARTVSLADSDFVLAAPLP